MYLQEEQKQRNQELTVEQGTRKVAALAMKISMKTRAAIFVAALLLAAVRQAPQVSCTARGADDH